jgi:hypothetical protein
MKKSEANVTHDEQSVAGKLEAPVRLTPDQLETVAAGFMAQLVRGGGAGGGTATTGAYPTIPIKLK